MSCKYASIIYPKKCNNSNGLQKEQHDQMRSTCHEHYFTCKKKTFCSYKMLRKQFKKNYSMSTQTLKFDKE